MSPDRTPCFTRKDPFEKPALLSVERLNAKDVLLPKEGEHTFPYADGTEKLAQKSWPENVMKSEHPTSVGKNPAGVSLGTVSIIIPFNSIARESDK